MKELYKSPVITVEELKKADVLCASGGDKKGLPGGKSNPLSSSKLWENNGLDISKLL